MVTVMNRQRTVYRSEITLRLNSENRSSVVLESSSTESWIFFPSSCHLGVFRKKEFEEQE